MKSGRESIESVSERNNRTDHPNSYLDTLMKSGRESIEAIMRTPVRRNCGAHEHETAEVRDVRRTGGGRGLRRGAGNIMDGVSPGGPQSFRYQSRPVDDCSPGRGGMAQTAEQGAERFMANGSLQIKPSLDYGMQSYART